MDEKKSTYKTKNESSNSIWLENINRDVKFVHHKRFLLCFTDR